MTHKRISPRSASVRVQGNKRRCAEPRKKWTEKELLKGVTPEMCGPDLIPDRAGREII
jgi:hypothetical protein